MIPKEGRGEICCITHNRQIIVSTDIDALKIHFIGLSA